MEFPSSSEWVFSSNFASRNLLKDKKKIIETRNRNFIIPNVLLIYSIACSYFKIIYYTLRSKFVETDRQHDKVRRIIIGSNQTAYKHLVFDNLRRTCIINDDSIGTLASNILASYGILNFLSFLKAVNSGICHYRMHICDEFQLRKTIRDFFPMYVVAVVFFSSLIKNKSIFVHCYGRSSWSYAASSVGAKVILSSHGLIGMTHYQVWHKIYRLYVQNKDEAMHYSKVDKLRSIKLLKFPMIDTHNKTVIVFLGGINRSMSELRPMCDFFRNRGYKVLIAAHPSVNKFEYFDSLLDLKDDFIDRNGILGEDLMVKYRPMFVASWASTTLSSSLRMGVIPIRFLDSDQNKLHLEMSFDFNNRTLSFPNDLSVITYSIKSKKNYVETLLKLNS